MSVSDTGSERDLLHDMCLEPTLEVQEEVVFRAIALDSGGFVEGPLLRANEPLFEEQAGILDSNTSSKIASIEAHESTSVSPAGPPRMAAPIPKPSNVVLCSSAPTHFLPILKRTLESHRCIRYATNTNDLFFGRFAKESEWQWRCTHLSQTCSQIELEVSVWNTSPSMECKPHLYSDSPSGFAIEFQKMGGDTFSWNRLLSDLKRDLVQLDGAFSCPQSEKVHERPALYSGQTLTIAASASPDTDEAGSVFDPLLGMLVQTKNKRLQLEGLRACNLLLREDQENLPKLVSIFNENTKLFKAFGEVLRGDSFMLPESQRIVLCILQMITADSPVARERIQEESHAYRPHLERIAQAQEQKLWDEMSVSRAKQILGL